jgi:prepilin signal peptidase PulO-like enzyme (type II secretory pathway)
MIGPILGALAGLVAGYISRAFAQDWQPRRPDALTLASGVLGALLVSQHPFARGEISGVIVATILVGLLTLIAASDIRERAVYPLLVYPAVILTIVAAPSLGIWRIDAVKGAAFMALLFLLVYLAARVISGPGALGMGDVSVAVLVGAIAGLSRIDQALIILGFAGGLMALAAAIRARSFRTAFPYAPALCLGALGATMV